MPFRTHVPLKWTVERDKHRPDEAQRCIAPLPCAHKCVRDRLKYVSQLLLVQICSSRPCPAVAHAPFTKVCRMRTAGMTPASYRHPSHCAMSRARVRQPLCLQPCCVSQSRITILRLPVSKSSPAFQSMSNIVCCSSKIHVIFVYSTDLSYCLHLQGRLVRLWTEHLACSECGLSTDCGVRSVD